MPATLPRSPRAPTADDAVVKAAVRYALAHKLEPGAVLTAPLPAAGGRSVSDLVQNGDADLVPAVLAAFAARG